MNTLRGAAHRADRPRGVGPFCTPVHGVVVATELPPAGGAGAAAGPAAAPHPHGGTAVLPPLGSQGMAATRPRPVPVRKLNCCDPCRPEN